MQKTAQNCRLTARQERCLLALLSEPSIRESAKVGKVSERTIYGWLKDPVFADAYQHARRDAMSRTMAALQQSSQAVVAVLRDIALDAATPAPARVSAAKTVLELSIRVVETEDLDTRIRKLEEQNEHAKK